MTKQEILERYLNPVYFGGGAYGVQAAAEIYWGKNVEELDWGQAALLASLIQNPVGYDPVREPDVARQRRRVALNRIVELGYITQEEADYYDVAGLPQARIDVLPEPNDYFVEEVKQQLLDMEELGATPRSATTPCSRGACASRPRSARRPSSWPSRRGTTSCPTPAGSSRPRWWR